MSSRGVSPVLASILIVMVAISLSGAFLLFTQSTATSLTESGQESRERLQAELDARPVIEGVSENKVFLRNAGSDNITSDALTVFLDDVRINHTLGSAIRPGSVGTVHLNDTWVAGHGEMNLRIATGMLSDSTRTVTERPDGNVLDLGLDETGGTDGANILNNSGFETYSTSPGEPEWWNDETGGKATFERESGVTRAGDNSVKITVDDNLESWQLGLKQDFVLNDGRTYYVGGAGRTTGKDSERVRFQLHNNDLSQGRPGSLGEPGATDWEVLGVTFTGEGDEYQLQIGHEGLSDSVGDVVYIDSLEIREVEAKDASGNGNHGSIRTNSPAAAGPEIGSDGSVGTSYRFDGSGDYLNVPDADSLDLRDGITVEARVRGEDVGTDFETLVTKASGQALCCNAFSYNLRLSSDGIPEFSLNITGSFVKTDGTTLQNGRWYHLVGTYDGSEMRLYVDGELMDSEAVTGSIEENDYDVRVGSIGNDEFTGRLDEVRIYGSALTPNELYSVNSA